MFEINNEQKDILINIGNNLDKNHINDFSIICKHTLEFYKNPQDNLFGKFLKNIYLSNLLKMEITNIDFSSLNLSQEEINKELEIIKNKINMENNNIISEFKDINIFDFYKIASVVEQNIGIVFIKNLYKKGLEYQSQLIYNFEKDNEKILPIYLNTYKYGNKMFQEHLNNEITELEHSNKNYNIEMENSIQVLEIIISNPSILLNYIK